MGRNRPTIADEGFRVVGLNEFRRALKEADPALGKELGKANQRLGRTYFEPEAKRRAGARTNPRPGHRVIDSITATAVQSAVKVAMGGAKAPEGPGHEFGSAQRRSTGVPKGHTTQFPVRSGRFGRGNAGYFFWPAIRATVGKIRDAYDDILLDLAKRVAPD